MSIYGGFSGSSVGKESACNAGDPGSIPGPAWSPGEGIGYPLQYSWVSLVAQLVKNLPAIRETWVQPLGWKDPLEAGLATHSSILAWRIPMDRVAWQATVHGSQRAGHDWATKHSTAHRKWSYWKTSNRTLSVREADSHSFILLKSTEEIKPILDIVKHSLHWSLDT